MKTSILFMTIILNFSVSVSLFASGGGPADRAAGGDGPSSIGTSHDYETEFIQEQKEHARGVYSEMKSAFERFQAEHHIRVEREIDKESVWSANSRLVRTDISSSLIKKMESSLDKSPCPGTLNCFLHPLKIFRINEERQLIREENGDELLQQFRTQLVELGKIYIDFAAWRNLYMEKTRAQREAQRAQREAELAERRMIQRALEEADRQKWQAESEAQEEFMNFLRFSDGRALCERLVDANEIQRACILQELQRNHPRFMEEGLSIMNSLLEQ